VEWQGGRGVVFVTYVEVAGEDIDDDHDVSDDHNHGEKRIWGDNDKNGDSIESTVQVDDSEVMQS
jgi:hypothetical protein